MGPGVAQECVETKDGLHIWEDHFLPEVIDPVYGTVLPDGETGELLFTSLTKQALPIIRYRTRDLTALRPGTARPAFRRMDKVTGRSDDMIILRGVNVFPTQIEEIVLGTAGLSPHFQLRLSRRTAWTTSPCVVEARPDAATPRASRPPREVVGRRQGRRRRDRRGRGRGPRDAGTLGGQAQAGHRRTAQGLVDHAVLSSPRIDSSRNGVPGSVAKACGNSASARSQEHVLGLIRGRLFPAKSMVARAGVFPVPGSDPVTDSGRGVSGGWPVIR